MFQVHSKVIQLLIYIHIIFQIIFHYRLLQDTDYTVNLCCLFHIYFLFIIIIIFYFTILYWF